jgi:predicted enzyme related to lactoylglutathione lyase
MKRLFAVVLLTAALFSPHAALAQNMPAGAVAATPRLVMVKIYVTDFARSERFYKQVFGLGAPRVYNASEHSFAFPDQNGVLDPNSTLLVLVLTPTPRPSSPFAMTVSDVDAVMSRAPAAGGAVTRPAPATTTGHARIAMITDPDGVPIEVIQPVTRP